MIPCVFNSKASKEGREAERAMYQALKLKQTQTRLKNNERIFGFVYHDQTFDNEEIDFVFLTIYGVIVVECKAVKRKTQAQSNFDKAHGQLHRKVGALVKSLESFQVSMKIPIFKVVAFPFLSRCDIEIVDETRVFFKENLSDVEIWLRRIVPPKSSMIFQQYLEIAFAFLRKYHTNTRNESFANGLEHKTRGIQQASHRLDNYTVKYLTKEQAVLVNIRHSEDVWVTGAAGTGKTFVLKVLVKRLADRYPLDEGKKILVITYNVPIKTDIK